MNGRYVGTVSAGWILAAVTLLAVGCGGAPTDTPDASEREPGGATSTSGSRSDATVPGDSVPLTPLETSPASAPVEAIPGAGTESPRVEVSEALRNAPAVQAAVADAADRKGLSSDAVAIRSVEEVTWSDSSLGCPQGDQMYMPVLTPGYRVVLLAGDDRMVYHTDRREQGPAIVLCEEGPAPPDGGLQLTSDDTLDLIRRDLEQRLEAGVPIALESTEFATVSELACDPVPVDATAESPNVGKTVIEYVLIADGTRHRYLAWMEDFEYCGVVQGGSSVD